MTLRTASCDVHRSASLNYSAVFSNSETFILCHEQWFVMKCLIHVVLWTRLRVSFNACVDPLFDVQVIYRALTRQPTTG
jgi:hypothetical protein